jgi:hypothetical protein
LGIQNTQTMNTIILDRPIEVALLFHAQHGSGWLRDKLKEIEFSEDCTKAWINPSEPNIIFISGDNGLLDLPLNDVIKELFKQPEITFF